jgi:hypothetical protein
LLFVFFLRLLEEQAEHGDVAEDGDLGLAVGDGVAHEAADDHRLLIAHDERRVGGALVDGDRAERAERRAGVGDLLDQLEAHLIGVVDVRRDLDLRADVLARSLEAEAAAEAAEAAERAERAEARRGRPSRRRRGR